MIEIELPDLNLLPIKYLESCVSTSDSSFSNGNSSVLVWTKEQTNGKGQQGSVWESDPKVNFLASFHLLNVKLPISSHAYLNMAICLGVFWTIKSFIDDVEIKWPNDIYVNGRKISGILIETNIGGVHFNKIVIGIGVNVNQLKFVGDYRATSLAIELGLEVRQEDVKSELIANLNRSFKMLEEDSGAVYDAYHSNLYRRGVSSMFSSQEFGEFEGEIQHVDENGQLIVKDLMSKKMLSFQPKQIAFRI